MNEKSWKPIFIEGYGGARPYIPVAIGGTGPHWGIPPYGGTHDYTGSGAADMGRPIAIKDWEDGWIDREDGLISGDIFGVKGG
ncbi:hypothetical protein LCGC14_1049390 [marine sediment metagenome]|uniref:Uncharacterized protein n=1 Tax=marine sediment metagenome TaxID=412755 RepID=A0A0F9Q7C4_9ZZZZ